MEAVTTTRKPTTATGTPRTYDAIVVGGGHNGLTTAAYLARSGMRVLVLERRPILGGACVTEELWPGRRVSRASYVVSMLQPQIVADLQLQDFGYRAVPLDPAYAALTEDGPVVFHDDSRQTAESIRSISPHDADNFASFEDRLFRVAKFLRPMMLREPPALGSKSPRDLLSLAREAGRATGLSRSEVHEVVRMFTMSVADLLDDYFEHEALKGSIASTGVVGVWAGPNTPGTAYNLLHHALGELNGIEGAWGHVIGGMGAISEAIAASARAAGAETRTEAEVVSIDVQGERAVGVTLASGEQLRAPIIASGAHPKTTVLDLAGAENFPTEVVDDMRRYRTRGGSVKINMALSEPPRYEGVSEEMQETLRHTGVNLAPSIDYLERAWQDALGGRPAAEPYVECELPSAIDSSLTDDGTWVMTMFTQYGPHEEKGWPDGARDSYADACIEHLARYAPNVPDADRRARGARPSGHRADLRDGGRLDLPGRAGTRSDGLHAPLAAALRLRHAGPRPLPLWCRDPPGRRGHGRPRPQRCKADPSRPPLLEAAPATRRSELLKDRPGRLRGGISLRQDALRGDLRGGLLSPGAHRLEAEGQRRGSQAGHQRKPPAAAQAGEQIAPGRRVEQGDEQGDADRGAELPGHAEDRGASGEARRGQGGGRSRREGAEHHAEPGTGEQPARQERGRVLAGGANGGEEVDEAGGERQPTGGGDRALADMTAEPPGGSREDGRDRWGGREGEPRRQRRVAPDVGQQQDAGEEHRSEAGKEDRHSEVGEREGADAQQWQLDHRRSVARGAPQEEGDQDHRAGKRGERPLVGPAPVRAWTGSAAIPFTQIKSTHVRRRADSSTASVIRLARRPSSSRGRPSALSPSTIAA